MKKFLTYFALVLCILLLVVYLGGTYFLGSIVKTGVNKFAPKITQTNVVLEGATISPFTGSGTLTGLAVDNPKGWTEGRAFYLKRVHLSMKPFSVFGDHIVIEEIEIEQPEFLYETKIISSNINDLLKNIEQSVGGSDGTSTAKTSSGKPIKFEVRSFRLTQGKVTVGVAASSLVLAMPPIELKDLGTSNGGITADQLALAVMKSVTSSVVSATTQAAGQIGPTTGAAVIEKAKKAGEDLKKMFGGGK